MNHLVELKQITKRYGSRYILKETDLNIDQGQSIAFIGRNGSGKSTLLKILSGLVRPSGGTVSYCGKPLFHYIPEHFPKLNLTAHQYLRAMGRIDGITEGEFTKRCQELLCSFYMEDMAETPMKYLSKGTLQKVGVIQALLKIPDILILDEPLSGQDVQSQEMFVKLMKEQNQGGMTLVMACHEKYLVEQLAQEVYQIDQGCIKMQGGDITVENHD